MRSIYLSLGSNIGNKVDYLNRAVKEIKAAGIDVVAQSKYYKTAPVGYLEQDVFINIAVKLNTKLMPDELLKILQSIEQKLHRKRIIKWGPRTIDIDIIWIEDLKLNTQNLVVPHPRAFERAFVIVPMLDLPIEDSDFKKQLMQAKITTKHQVIDVYDISIKALNPSHVKTIKVGDNVFGENKPILIAGPCSVESEKHIHDLAKSLKLMGVDILRGGVFKPRTSPYDFQGLGYEGLEYIKAASVKYDIPFVTEVMDIKSLDKIANMADIIQIGARNMYNYSLLKEVGRTNKPVLLKRNFAATIKEWVMAAEYIASMGNDNIILCERGIRSYDPYTRNVLDLAAVPIMQAETGLPVIADPSHGTGLRELIAPMSKAALAAGADGLMIEVHADPDNALSDGKQSIRPATLNAIIDDIKHNMGNDVK